jgi:predicted metal-binding membrane protein
VGISLLVLVQKTLPWSGMMSRLAGVVLAACGVTLPGMAA